MAKTISSRYFQAVMYPENMRPDWQDEIPFLVQLPFAYCIHDKDHLSKHFLPDKMQVDEDLKRKVHVHIILAFPNTTTMNHALSVFRTLNAPGKNAIPGDYIQQVFSIRSAFDYLIHKTDAAKKAGKFEYPVCERIIGNCFDIGAYEQISIADKDRVRKELANLIFSKNFVNYTLFYQYVICNFDESIYEQTVSSNSGFFERLTRGNYQLQKIKDANELRLLRCQQDK